MSATEQHLLLNNTVARTARSSHNTQSIRVALFFHAGVQSTSPQQQKEAPCFPLNVNQTLKQTCLVQRKSRSLFLSTIDFRLLISVRKTGHIHFPRSISCKHTLTPSNHASTPAACLNLDPSTLGGGSWLQVDVWCVANTHPLRRRCGRCWLGSVSPQPAGSLPHLLRSTHADRVGEGITGVSICADEGMQSRRENQSPENTPRPLSHTSSSAVANIEQAGG